MDNHYIDSMEASYYEDDSLRDLDVDIEGNESKSVKCKYCNLDGLIWKESSNGWRLFDGLEPHRCRSYNVRKKVSSDVNDLLDGVLILNWLCDEFLEMIIEAKENDYGFDFLIDEVKQLKKDY